MLSLYRLRSCIVHTVTLYSSHVIQTLHVFIVKLVKCFFFLLLLDFSLVNKDFQNEILGTGTGSTPLLRKWCHNNKHFTELGPWRETACVDMVWINHVTASLCIWKRSFLRREQFYVLRISFGYAHCTWLRLVTYATVWQQLCFDPCLFVRLVNCKSDGWISMKFEDQVSYGPEKSWLNIEMSNSRLYDVLGAWSVCRSVVCHDREPCKMAEPIEMPFGVWTQRKHVLDGSTHRSYLANTIEPFMCGGDAVFLSNYFDHLLILHMFFFSFLPARR